MSNTSYRYRAQAMFEDRRHDSRINQEELARERVLQEVMRQTAPGLVNAGPMVVTITENMFSDAPGTQVLTMEYTSEPLQAVIEREIHKLHRMGFEVATPTPWQHTSSP